MCNVLPDIIAKDLTVLFCGINPGVSAATAGHHFVGRGNRFWRVIHQAGFTPHEISPCNDPTILHYRCGLTAVVPRPTASAREISTEEFRVVAKNFELKIFRFAPIIVAFLGKAAYSTLSGQRDIVWGPQTNTIAGATVWVLPNPSGRNLAFSLDRLVDSYRQLYESVDLSWPSGMLVP
jgi:TDG/mug DNA glycosylase family protein